MPTSDCWVHPSEYVATEEDKNSWNIWKRLPTDATTTTLWITSDDVGSLVMWMLCNRLQQLQLPPTLCIRYWDRMWNSNSTSTPSLKKRNHPKYLTFLPHVKLLNIICQFCQLSYDKLLNSHKSTSFNLTSFHLPLLCSYDCLVSAVGSPQNFVSLTDLSTVLGTIDHASHTHLFTSAKEVMFSSLFVCLPVCLSVSNFAQKLLNGFKRNFQGRLTMGQWTNFGGIRITVWIQGLFSVFVTIGRYR